LSPYTIPDIVSMVKFAGERPVFVDNLPHSTNVDVDHLSSLIDATVACVLITHHHVNQNQLIDIRHLCRRGGILLFDDCALALGGQYQGALIGTCTAASVFSMSGFKPLIYFWGGAITTSSLQIAGTISEEVKQWPELRVGQYASQILRTIRYDLSTRPLAFSSVTFPVLRKMALRLPDAAELLPSFRIDNKKLDRSLLSRPSSAAMHELQRKLRSVEFNIAHRRTIASVYNEILGDCMVSNDTHAQTRLGSCFVSYPIVVDPEDRTRIYKRILSQGWDVGLSSYPNVHEMKGFKEIPGRSRNVSNLVRSTLTLPTHPRITEEYASRLAHSVRKAVSIERKKILPSRSGYPARRHY
jgi:perosamine synthetase